MATKTLPDRFHKQIDEALGEAAETQSWLDDPLDCGYLEPSQFEKMDADWRSITAMLTRMIDRASDFCKYSSDTDYRGMTREDPHTWRDEDLDDSDEASYS
jgi:hypothetical protein